MERGRAIRQRILDIPRRHPRLHDGRPRFGYRAGVRHVQKVLEVKRRAHGVVRLMNLIR